MNKKKLGAILYVFALLASLFLFIQPVQAGGPAIDATATNGSASCASCTVTITTTQKNDVLVLYVSESCTNTCTLPKISTVADGSTLTWALRGSNYTLTQSTLAYEDFVFWASSSAKLTSDTITVTFASGIQADLTVAAINGLNTGSPWDSVTPFCNIQADTFSGTTSTNCTKVTKNNSVFNATITTVAVSDFVIGFASADNGLTAQFPSNQVVIGSTTPNRRNAIVNTIATSPGVYTVAAGNNAPGSSCTQAGTVACSIIADAMVTGTGVATTSTQTIGDCTATATGGTYLTNSTQYWYGGNALGQETVQTIKTQVENIKGSGSHTLQLLIYMTASNAAAQAPSVSYPAILGYSKSFIITSGTTNSTITLNVNIPLNTAALSPLPFNFWAVGIVGDDHIRIHNSATSGMVTQTGAASTATQPSQFTGPGAATTTKLQLCAVGNYQTVIAGTTTTTTASATSTSQITVTNTINTIGPSLFSTQSNWPVIFLILLLPAGLFLGVTKTLAGALLGLVVGSTIGLMMGIIPGFIFIGVIIALAAVAFIARNNSG